MRRKLYLALLAVTSSLALHGCGLGSGNAPAAGNVPVSGAGNGNVPAGGSRSYTLIDLGVAPGYLESAAAGLNNNGDVIGGMKQTNSIFPYAFLYHNGKITELSPNISTLFNANAINDNGEVACFTSGAARFSGGAFTLLDGADGRGASCINSSGVVGGNVVQGSLPSQPALFSALNAPTVLPILPGDTLGNVAAVNDAGVAAGTSTHGLASRAVMWKGGSIVDLGAGDFSTVSGINSKGDIVGTYNHPVVKHAFLWSNGTLTDLGTLPGTTNSSAASINSAGMIVGTSGTDRSVRAFLYSNGKMVDLNTLVTGTQFVMTAATGINEKGQICGYGATNKDDFAAFKPYTTHAFLLTPN